ncbi:MAG: sigma 54-interacting transcriptional regulator [Betaproteobacteria bacterium]
MLPQRARRRQERRVAAGRPEHDRFNCKQAGYVLIISVPLQSADGAAHRSATLPEREDFPTIIGRSVRIREVCQRIGSLHRSDVTVLLQGESGTGKEIVANAVHAHSTRGRAHFVKVNCAAITETLFESELFGHVKGAFTGAIRERRSEIH